MSAPPGSVLNRVLAGPPPAGHRVSFVRLDGTETIGLVELYRRAGTLALALRRRGLRRGDRLGVLAGNGLEWVLADLAALRLGAVTVGLEPGKFAPDAALLDRYQLTLLCTDHPVPGGPSDRVLAMPEVRALADGPAAEQPEPLRYGPTDVVALKLTSGSTGEPKGITASAGSVDSSLSAVQRIFRHGPGDDLFLFLPLSLIQQRYWLYSALCFGHDVTISTYQAALPALRRAAPTVVMGVPAFYQTAREFAEPRGAGAARELFGGRIRYLWTGSAPADPTTLTFFTDAGLPIYEGYGLNETCIVSKNHPGAHREGSVGQVLPGKQVLLDPDGVISVRSDHPVATGYAYARPGESERVFRPGGVVRTGDLGHLDADGFLFIRGRADDVIVLGNGKKIIVRPIEEAMKASPDIAECVLFCPTQTELVAVVSPGREPADEAAIAAHLARTNAGLEPDERIGRVVLAPHRFSVHNGLLTSQFKPRRGQILAAHRLEIHDTQRGIHAP